MNIERIQEVTNDWRSANWKVIEFENPGFKEVRKLFLETYEIIEKYRDEKYSTENPCIKNERQEIYMNFINTLLKSLFCG